MRRIINSRLFLALAMLTALPLVAQDYKAGAVTKLPDVPKVLQDAVQPEGASLLDGQGEAVAEVWLAKALTGQANAGSMDVIYGDVAPGSFVGVIHFPNAGADFRGQKIKSGFYTLRYDLIPQDGNHMGVSQYRDFILLLPIDQDADPAKSLKYEDVIKLSRQASGTGHPSILSLDPVEEAPAQFPGALKDYSDNWALVAKTQVKPEGGEAKDLPMAIILVGKYEG
jgi:hypothetical protein